MGVRRWAPFVAESCVMYNASIFKHYWNKLESQAQQAKACSHFQLLFQFFKDVIGVFDCIF